MIASNHGPGDIVTTLIFSKLPLFDLGIGVNRGSIHKEKVIKMNSQYDVFYIKV